MSFFTNENSISQNAGFIIRPDNYLKFLSGTLSNASRYFDCCFVPSIHSSQSNSLICNDSSSSLSKMTKHLLDKGVTCRFITEITRETLTYWKEFINNSDVRHVDCLRVSFSLCDGEQYWGFATEAEHSMQKKELVTPITEQQLLLYSNNRSFVEMQQFLFDNLWNNAVPAKERIVRIERDRMASIINLTTEPEQVFGYCIDYLAAAIYEILVIVPTVAAARSIEDRGILDLLRNAGQNGVEVKILIHLATNLSESENEAKRTEILLKGKDLDKKMNFLYKNLDSQDITIIIDQAISFSLKLRCEVSNKEHVPAIVGASCSNDESTLSFNVSMFESLWIQSEFEKQNKIKQVYFQLFKGLKLKDETYQREWTSEQNLDRGIKE
jgi:two-component system sensor histidine kinase VicK